MLKLMKKTPTLLFFCLIIVGTLYTQNCGTTLLCTQTEVDNLNCSNVNGGFFLGHPNPAVCGGSTNITDLSNLSQVTSIKDFLVIKDNANLVSLSGMENIGSVGDTSNDNIDIADNPLLTDISALNGITNFGIGFIIFSNNGFVNLAMPTNLVTLPQTIQVQNESNLVTLDFNNFQSGAGVLVRNSPMLNMVQAPVLTTLSSGVTLDNLPSLTTADFSTLSTTDYVVLLNDNSSLSTVDFTSISNLTGSGGNGSLEVNNTALTDMTGFAGLQTIDDRVYITNNASLTSLDGLNNITAINDFIVIQDNPNLNDCCAILDLINNGGISGSINLSGNGVNCNSVAAIQAACAALPVEFLTFNGVEKDGQVQLTWETASENNNAGFEVQKSERGVQWQKLGFIQGQGTSQESQLYSFTDQNPTSGYNYYRLKQIDNDGAYEYSPIRTVLLQSEVKDKITVYPNPATNQLFIENGQGTVSIFNVMGQLIRRFTIQTASATINIEDLHSGSYFLTFITDEGERNTVSFLK